MLQKRVFYILLFMSMASFLQVIYLIYDYQQSKSELLQTAIGQIEQEIDTAVQQIDSTLTQLLSFANVLADELSAEELPQTQIRNRLAQLMEIAPHLFGIGVAYIPYLNTPQARRQSPYYIKRHNSEQQDIIELFTVPCFYPAPETDKRIPKCVVFIDYYLKNLNKLMTTLKLGNNGYGFILSKQGVFINHPLPDYVKKRKTQFEMAALQNDSIFEKLKKQTINTKGVIEHIHEKTGQPAWIFYQTIPITGWIVYAVVLKEEILDKTGNFRTQQITLSLGLLIFVVFVFGLFFRVDRGDRFSLWQMTASTSTLLLASIGFVLYLVQTGPLSSNTARTIIVDNVNLQKLLTVHTQQTPQFEPKSPVLVPTGLIINALQFSEPNQIKLKGYIWQHYDDKRHHHISHGFKLPQALSINILESYRHKEKQIETIGWFFEATIPQQFDYSTYPFDTREINLLIQHKDFDQNIILIPDLETYINLNPESLPGIKQDIVLSGWNFVKSYFYYLNSNQIIENEIAKPNIPSLYFTTFTKRNLLTLFTQQNLLNSFVGSVLPAILLGLMLFALLLLLGRVTHFANVGGSLSILFLGLILAHLALRKLIPTSEIIYIDYVYIIIYIAIILVMIIYLLYDTSRKFLLIQYREGLIPKLLFWPLILASLLGITIISLPV